MATEDHIMNQLLQTFDEVKRMRRWSKLNTGLLRTTGARLLAIRKDMGLTQPKFAREMEKVWGELKRQGVDGTFTRPGASTISDWETDDRRMPREAILIVAEMWKTTTDFLLCAPWTISEHRPGENNSKPVYWHEEVDLAAAQLDALEPGLRHMVVRRLPSVIEGIRNEWQAQISKLAEMRAKMVEVLGEDAVREWERKQGKSMQSDGG